MVKIKNILIAGMMVVLILASNGCGKEDASSEPALPPLTSMKMDTSFVKKSKSALLYDYVYYTQASVTVGIWSIAAYLHTALPVVAFEKAINTKPTTYDNVNKVWVWSFKFTYLVEYQAELTGKLSEDKVLWTMNISKVSDPTTKFKWFDGESQMDQKAGWWKIYSPELGEVIKITWTKESDNLGTLRYTNIISGDANKEGFIEFGQVTGTLDKYFSIKIISDAGTPANSGKTFKIEWSSTTKEGSISDVTSPPVKLGCWGTDFKDKPCN